MDLSLKALGIATAFALLAMGCSEEAIGEAATAKIERDRTVVVDIGRRPPNLSAEVETVLPALTTPATYVTSLQSCGCFAFELREAGKKLERGDAVAAGTLLELVGTFRPKTRSGAITEQVRVDFCGANGVRTHRTLQVSAVLASEASVANKSFHEKGIALPAQTTVLQVELRRPADATEVGVDGGTWLRLIRASAEQTRTDVLDLEAGPFRVPGDYRGSLRLPLGQGVFEIVSILVRVRAQETFSPRRVITELPTGATARYPVRLRSPAQTRIVASRVDGAARADDGNARAFRVSLVSAAAESLHLDVAAGDRPGLYEGRLLAQPREDSPYEIPLYYTVRVVGTPEQTHGR